MTDPYLTDPTLRPGDHYKCLGDDEWHTVPELRTVASPDQRGAIAAELRRRDDGFLSVGDVGDGSGTYTAVVNGKVTTKRFTFDVSGDGIVAISSPAFPKAQNAVTAAAAANPYTPPNPYTAGLAQLRAANATDLSWFEDEYKARRLAELEREHAVADARVAAVPRMTAAEEAELARYAPPKPYTAALKALKEKETR